MTSGVDYLIIGGGIAGTTAAETLRKHDAESRIVIVSQEPHPLYARLELSKSDTLLGRTPEEKLWLRNPEWYASHHIELYSGKKAVALDHSLRQVTLDDGTALPYRKLLLAIGVKPRMLGCPGEALAGIFLFSTLDDFRGIQRAIRSRAHGGRAVIIGGGFIAFEAADACRQAGFETTVLLRDPHFFSGSLKDRAGAMVTRALMGHGIHLLPNEEIEEIVGEENVRAVRTKSGKELPADLVIVGIGASCSADFVRKAGGEVRRGIVTDTTLKTNLPDVYAAGDCTEFFDETIGEHTVLGNWTSALLQGRAAARAMLEDPRPPRTISIYSSSAFGLALVFLGDTALRTGRRTLDRVEPGSENITQLLLSGNHLVGAVLINRNQELPALTRLIRDRVDVSRAESQLGDPSFDLQGFFS
ncbi:MAG: NAD(P)/FAD-dependent oxidoreductase [Candidatus Terrybacteria bacterium]|nr:NAD(P)/FAD-dependent oxidoreductase [Candidatus Terrybacteria bacterium]